MDEYFGPNVFDARLEAWTCHTLYLNEFLSLFVRDIVPSAMERHWHTCVFSVSKRGVGNEYVGVDVLYITVLAGCTLLDKVEVKRIFIECSLYVLPYQHSDLPSLAVQS